MIDQASLLESIEKERLESVPVKKTIFVAKPASRWLKDASEKPIPNPLYFNLWYEGEVCIAFADTNVGKSILAVQIANKIAEKQPVIYFDFELSDKQFEARYSNNFTNHYPFPENFIRAEINPDEADYEESGFKSLEDFISYSIEELVKSMNVKAIIIDNITYLKTETEKAKEALPLMKQLKAIKNRHNLSILVLAHTPKRDASKPITRNDLQGSKMLINFCDSAFAIGESARDHSLRYVKQIKARNTAIEYDSENVLVFEITKPDNFLMFAPVHAVHPSCEHEHLKHYNTQDKESIEDNIMLLHKKNKSQRDIAKELGIGLGTVNKYLKRSLIKTGEQSEQA